MKVKIIALLLLGDGNILVNRTSREVIYCRAGGNIMFSENA